MLLGGSDSSRTDKLLQQLDALKLLEQDRHETLTTQITSIEDMINGTSQGQQFRGTRLESIRETLETEFEVLDSDNSKSTSHHLSTQLDPLMIFKSVPFAGLGSPLRSMARSLALQMLRVLLREIAAKGETGAGGVGIERSARPSFAVLYQWLSRDASSKNLSLGKTATHCGWVV